MKMIRALAAALVLIVAIAFLIVLANETAAIGFPFALLVFPEIVFVTVLGMFLVFVLSVAINGGDGGHPTVPDGFDRQAEMEVGLGGDVVSSRVDSPAEVIGALRDEGVLTVYTEDEKMIVIPEDQIRYLKFEIVDKDQEGKEE